MAIRSIHANLVLKEDSDSFQFFEKIFSFPYSQTNI